MRRRLNVGVCGGGFGMPWLVALAHHPEVSSVAAAEADPTRLASMTAGIPGATEFTSFEEMIADPSVDAVGIFTPPWLHAEHTIAALRAGKHVLCAVPLGLTLDEVASVVAEVERSGLIYMTGETSTYYSNFLYCRERYLRGDFGAFVMGRGHNLYHPSQYDFYTRDFYANFPPMLYATHTVSMVVGITGRRLTRVAAHGFVGLHPEMRGRKRLPAFADDEFGTESAMFLSAGGGNSHITEGRWIGHTGAGDNLFSVYGTDGSFEQHTGHETWNRADPGERIEVSEVLRSGESGRPVRPLPPAMRGAYDAIGYLVDDFVRAIADGRRPFNDVWQAARYCAPGIVAHESARRDGEWREIPDFGENPRGTWAPDDLDRVRI